VAIFQHSLPFLQSESFQIHVGTIHLRAIGPLAHHNGISAYSPSLACHLPAPTMECLHRPLSDLFKSQTPTAHFIWNLSLIYHTAVSIVMFPFKLLCYRNKSIVMQQDCYVTMEMQLLCRSCYQGNLICNNIYRHETKTERGDENKYIKENPQYPSKNRGIELRRDKTSTQSLLNDGSTYDTEIEF
jgi:hypothetical protein